ncbi:MAG: aspartate carbamoyltransferase catalytic subunit [Microbacteriaceae bacterium]
MTNLLSTKDLSLERAMSLLDIAEYMAETANNRMRKLPTLRGKTVVNLFYENSTRTRISFEAAANRLSADVINFSAASSSVSKGESLQDTAQTLEALGADGIVIRHPASGAAHFLASQNWIPGGVINAGDGMNEHPTQALLDAFTLRQRIRGAESTGKDLSGIKVIIVGDILHSRVARSNIWLLNTLGASVSLVAPPTLMPFGVESWPAQVFYDFDEAIATVQPDAVMLLRIQQERMHDAFFPNASEYGKNWGLGNDRFARLPKGCLVMHPGPMNRGLEISALAADSAESTVLDQVKNGVFIRMAALYQALSGPDEAVA